MASPQVLRNFTSCYHTSSTNYPSFVIGSCKVRFLVLFCLPLSHHLQCTGWNTCVLPSLSGHCWGFLSCFTATQTLSSQACKGRNTTPGSTAVWYPTNIRHICYSFSALLVYQQCCMSFRPNDVMGCNTTTQLQHYNTTTLQHYNAL